MTQPESYPYRANCQPSVFSTTDYATKDQYAQVKKLSAWLKENMIRNGTADYAWVDTTDYVTENFKEYTSEIRFKYQEDLLLFKLTWGG